jgi:uncharacterized metal-binding protein
MRIEEVAQIRYKVTYKDITLWFDTREEAETMGRRKLLERYFEKKTNASSVIVKYVIDSWEDIKGIMDIEKPKGQTETRKIEV